MRKTLYILFLCLLSVLAQAQVEVTETSVKKNKQNVEVSFAVNTDADLLKSRYKLVLTPFLYNNADTLLLPPVEIYGRTRYKRERQEQTLNGQPHWTLGAGQYLKGDACTYQAAIPYQRWMRTASLGLHRQLVGCGCDCYDGTQPLARDIAIYVPPTPAWLETEPDPRRYEVVDAKQRWDFGREALRVFFPVSKTVLLTDRYDNQATLQRIIAAIRRIQQTDSLRLNQVEITGFASPEGTLAFNTRLGEGRAHALKAYIQQEMPELQDENFYLINGVENWDGLRQMVAASDMQQRDDVLDIIDHRTGEARKTALKQLDGGRAYRHILHTFYPELRNACYIAVYFDRLDDRAATAINQANADIRAGRYAQALQTLRPHENDSRAWNSIGICHMMLEDETEAARWFHKAIEAGDRTAIDNLRQIE